jgi:large subunit ribosomal protein L3
MKGILGRKLGMTQIFGDDGAVIPVTIIEAGPCYVTQKKTVESDGYDAIQLGFGDVRQKSVNKPRQGHLNKSQVPLVKYLQEVEIDNVDSYEAGQTINASIFELGDFVDVIGTSKGKGFAGVVKRHNFSGGPKTHGQSDRWRSGGSIGAGTTPGRVFKGTRMAGRMGNDRVTIQNLKVALVDPEKNLIAVRGAVPGARNGLVVVRTAVKRGQKGGKQS